MKFIALIFYMYLLLLPLVPCADKNKGEENVKHEMVAGNENHQNKDESCPPFCYCSCCPVSVFTEAGNIYTLIEEKNTSSKQIYSLSFCSFDFHSIWQPPKLG